jgi:uncharacterized membrane protein
MAIGGNSVARLGLSLLLLYLPGYALTTALFPAWRLDGPERLLFSLALSLAVVVLSGLILNWTPWGLQTITWVIWLGAITLAAGGVALARWRKRLLGPADDHRAVLESVSAVLAAVHSNTASSQSEQLATREARAHRPLAIRQWLALGLAGLLAVAAVGLAQIGAAEAPTAGFTQLWLLPVDGGDASAVRLGVYNREAVDVSYQLRLEYDGAALYEWPAIVLHPGATWETVVTLPPLPAVGDTVTAMLSRPDSRTTPYRQVRLWRGLGQER